jgi:hypothetical protein
MLRFMSLSVLGKYVKILLAHSLDALIHTLSEYSSNWLKYFLYI